jgi:Calx-beta domain
VTNRRSLLLLIGLTAEIAVCGCSSNTTIHPSSASPAASASGAGTSSPVGQKQSEGAISFLVPAYTVSQSARIVVIAATRVAGSAGAVTVNYNMSNGSASAGADYTMSSGTLSWKDGDTANKTVSIPIADSNPFVGTKTFNVDLSMPSGTATLGTPSTVTVTIAGAGASPPAATAPVPPTPPPPAPPPPTVPPPTTIVSKSIREWVPCDGLTDYTDAVARALEAAGSGGFTLVVDCPVRLHSGAQISRSISISDGTTVTFTGDGEFRVVDTPLPAFEIAHPQTVSLVDWTVTYL